MILILMLVCAIIIMLSSNSKISTCFRTVQFFAVGR